MSRAELEGEDAVSRVVPVDDELGPAEEGGELREEQSGYRWWVLRALVRRVNNVSARAYLYQDVLRA